jgi:hypothetical protein
MNSGSSNPLRSAGRVSSEYGINDPTTRHASADAAAFCISSMALALGVVTIARAVLHTHPTGLAVTLGFGAMIAAIALWSLRVIDPTHHYLAVTVLGFALLLAPGFGGFTDDAAAWTAWASGLGATTLGLGGYLRGETPDFEATDRDPATARYHYPRRSTRRLKGRGNNGQQPVGRDRGRSPAGNRVLRRRDHDRGICAPVPANRNLRHIHTPRRRRYRTGDADRGSLGTRLAPQPQRFGSPRSRSGQSDQTRASQTR